MHENILVFIFSTYSLLFSPQPLSRPKWIATQQNAEGWQSLFCVWRCHLVAWHGGYPQVRPLWALLGIKRRLYKVRYLSCDGFSLHSVCCSFNRAMINPNSPPHQSNIRLPPRLSTQLNSPGYLPTLWVLCQAQILEITVVYLQSSQVQLNYFVSLRSIETSVSCIKMLTRFSI